MLGLGGADQNVLQEIYLLVMTLLKQSACQAGRFNNRSAGWQPVFMTCGLPKIVKTRQTTRNDGLPHGMFSTVPHKRSCGPQ